MSNTTKTATASTGVSMSWVVFMIFLVLKLTGTGPVAGWSWWAVTAPLWISYGVILVILLLAVIVLALIRLGESEDDRKKREAREAVVALAKSLK